MHVKRWGNLQCDILTDDEDVLMITFILNNCNCVNEKDFKRISRGNFTFHITIFVRE